MADLREMQQQIDNLTKQLEQQRKSAEETEARRRQELLTNSVREALTQNGADPRYIAIAMSHLEKTGQVKLAEGDKAVFSIARTWGSEDVPAADGAKKWLATEEGKMFLMPSGRQGTRDAARRSTSSSAAPRRSDGAVDWGALGQRVSLRALRDADD